MATETLNERPVEPDFGPSGIAVLESHHGPGFSMAWRQDPFPKLLVILAGSGMLRTETGDFLLEALTLVAVPRSVVHRIDDDSKPLSLYVLCLKPRGFPDSVIIEQACGEVRVHRDPAFAERAVSVVRQMLYEARSRSPESCAMLLGMTAQLLVSMIRSGDRTEGNPLSAEGRVRVYATELSHAFWVRENMDQIAARLGISRRRFSELFRAISGTSWLDKVHALRMDHAAHLLRHTAAPIKAVAFECGYDDLSHFYRRFTARFGIPPTTWRIQISGAQRTKGSKGAPSPLATL